MEFKRCFGCMRELDAPGAICPHCGYDNTKGPREQSPQALPCGSILNGKYVTGRVLGQGGFGITYIGFELTLEKPVCIKEYFPAGVAMRASTQSRLVLWSGGNTESMRQGRESFVREAQQAAKLERLSHVVNVTEVFYENETAYIAMEYIEGETLKDRLVRTQKPLGERECVELLTPVMQDLEKAHALGIIHRDIKPENIMLRKNGEPVLLDLGAAKDLIKAEKDGTLSSTAVVSEGFSPPEQYSRNTIPGSFMDVYAMCATIYYCVSGKVPPLPSEQMLGESIDFAMFPPEMKDTLQKGLALRPDDRIQTMGELLTALRGQEPDTREQDYQSARDLMGRGDKNSLWAAQRMFTALGGYRDAAALAKHCKKRLEETGEENTDDRGGIKGKNSGGEKPKPKLLIPLVAGALLLGAGGYYIGTHRDNAPTSTPVQVITEIETPTPTMSSTPTSEPTPTPKPTPIPTPSGSPISKGKQGDLSYAVYKDCVEITGCDKKAVTVQVPDAIEGKPVTSIGNYAFYYCTSLTSISLPESLTSIGSAAFYGCALTNLTIPRSVTNFGGNPAPACDKLQSFYVAEGNEAFTVIDGALYTKDKKTLLGFPAASSQKEIVIDKYVTSIGEQAFSGCTSLTSISLPESVTSIGWNAFGDCDSLKEIHAKAGSYAAERFAVDARLVID